MALTSLTFAAFALAIIVLYYLVPKRFRWCLLLIGSYVFYLWGGLGAGLYLLFVTAVTYVAGLLLDILGARKLRGRRLVVFLALLCNFGLLFLVKYWNFTASALGFLPQLDLLMPLGISFFIFQSSGYIIDVYRTKYAAQRNPLKLALFVAYFPQMVQGPISRYDDLMPKLLEGASLDWTNLQFGLQLTAWGLFKKLVIADRAAVLVDAIYANLSAYGGAMYAVAVLFYSIQLYCDFSGGIDIIRGISQMLGIELTENFKRPVFATSLADFWRRWHISLGTWMKDYLFYPLCLSKPLVKLGKHTRRRFRGKLGKVIPTSIATFAVYFVVGIWHGANFRYVAFGLYNGIWITAALLLEPSFAKIKARLHIPQSSRLDHVFCILRTAVLVFIGRYITRAPRLLTAGAMLLAAWTRPAFYQLYDGTLLRLGLTGIDFAVIGLSTALMLAVEAGQEHGVQIRKSLASRSAWVQWAIMFSAIVILLIFGVFRGDYIASQFIYQGF